MFQILFILGPVIIVFFLELALYITFIFSKSAETVRQGFCDDDDRDSGDDDDVDDDDIDSGSAVIDTAGSAPPPPPPPPNHGWSDS